MGVGDKVIVLYSIVQHSRIAQATKYCISGIYVQSHSIVVSIVLLVTTSVTVIFIIGEVATVSVIHDTSVFGTSTTCTVTSTVAAACANLFGTTFSTRHRNGSRE